MSYDLHEVFTDDRGTAPRSGIDLDVVVRRGRRLRNRRRIVVGTTGVLGAGVVAAGSVAVASHLGGSVASSGYASGTDAASSTSAAVPIATWVAATAAGPSSESPAPQSSRPTPTKSSDPAAGAPAALRSVGLANPAPGFPIRRWPDEVSQEGFGDGSARWVVLFGLAAQPPIQSTDAAGAYTGDVPTGPEVTMRVGLAPMGLAYTAFSNAQLGSQVDVAGVKGQLVTWSEKGKEVNELFFTRGPRAVEIIGFGGVTDDQLVALGNALTWN